METTHIILALIVIIIFLAIGYWDESSTLVKSTIMLAGFGLVALIAGQFTNLEHITSDISGWRHTIPATNKTSDGINIDDNRFSEYGNISLMNDINPLGQTQPNMRFDSTGADIDNSDVIEMALGRGSSTFQPARVSGVTPTSSATESHYRLAHPPSQDIAGLEYMTPINEAGLNADASIARKQQHRSSMNKRAIDGAVRSTRNKFAKYFTNELDENEDRVWWETDHNLETDWK